MRLAVEEAIKGVTSKQGSPFGAVIVKDGQVIATGCNQVSSTNDITAHAEIVAIRNATATLGSDPSREPFYQMLGTYSLSGCQIYASCQPCPMCLGAILWSRVDGIYYAASLKESAEIGFDAGHIWDFWTKGSPLLVEVPIEEKLKPFVFWNELLASITDPTDPRKILK